jgi:hypothetical protein
MSKLLPETLALLAHFTHFMSCLSDLPLPRGGIACGLMTLVLALKPALHFGVLLWPSLLCIGDNVRV